MLQNRAILALGAALAFLLDGCSTSKPSWENCTIAPQPCAEARHGHERKERRAVDLKLVTMDLSRYKSVQERPGQDPNLVLAVAISGGGERSANFALGVLLELENLKHQKSNALKEIDYFSTVSGGGMAAGGYISELLGYAGEHGTTEGFDLNFAVTNCCHGPGKQTDKESLKKLMKRGYHATILRNFLSVSDAFSWNTRGDYFERALDEYVLGRIDHPHVSLALRDLFVPKQDTNQVLAPCWIPNATVLANGAVFPFTPDVLEQYGVSHYYHDLKRRPLFCPYDLPLAVGLKASISVPVAVRSSTLELSNHTAKMFLQLADGGLADNLGVFTAMEAFKGTPSNATKVLLVIDAYNGSGLPFVANRSSPSVATMARRTADIPLDAWRVRARRVIEDLGRTEGVEVIFLSFDELVEHSQAQDGRDSCNCYNFIRQSASQPLDSEKFKKRLRDVQTAARKVPTSLSISPKDQELLLTAGRLVVCLHEDLIRQKLKWLD